MEFPDRLVAGRFVGRPNRFLALVECGGREVTAHLANTGRLSEILVPGRPVYLLPAKNPHRKTAFSLILADLDGVLVGLNSAAANDVAYEYLSRRLFDPFSSYALIRREVTFTDGRYDLFLTEQGLPDLIVEVKGVNLVRGGRALFPDAPTERGTKHLRGLMEARERGLRAAALFVVMRDDAQTFSPNDEADARFAAALRAAHGRGVELFALVTRVTVTRMDITGAIPVVL